MVYFSFNLFEILDHQNIIFASEKGQGMSLGEEEKMQNVPLMFPSKAELTIQEIKAFFVLLLI